MNKPIFTGVVLFLIAFMGLVAIYIFMQKVESPASDNIVVISDPVLVDTSIVSVQPEEFLYTCEEKEVDLENYTEKGRQLENCFIEYPIEATVETDDYQIVEDICGQFTQRFIENMLGKPIVTTKESEDEDTYNCLYYFELTSDENDKFLSINLEYLSLDSQKRVHEILGRTVVSDEEIEMQNFLVTQVNGVLNTVYLGLTEEKFISIRPNTINVLGNAEFVAFARNIANVIKDYK